MEASQVNHHSLERVIKLCKQEFIDKLQLIKAEQKTYQRKNDYYQQTLNQENQARQTAVKASSLVQKTTTITSTSIPELAPNRQKLAHEKARIDFSAKIAKLNASNTSLYRALANEALIDADNKILIHQSEARIIYSQLAMLRQYRRAALIHAQLRPLIKQQQELATQVTAMADIQQTIDKIKAQLTDKTPPVKKQALTYAQQIKQTEQKIGQLTTKYRQAAQRLTEASEQQKLAEHQFINCQQQSQKIQQQTKEEYASILQAGNNALNSYQCTISQLQKQSENKSRHLQELTRENAQLKLAIKNTSDKMQPLEDVIDKAETARQRLVALLDQQQAASETAATIRTALQRVISQLNKAQQSLAKSASQKQSLQDKWLAGVQAISTTAKELEELQKKADCSSSYYHQLEQKIEGQKQLAQARQAQIDNNAIAAVAAAAEQLNSQKALVQIAAKKAVGLHFALVLAKYLLHKLQHTLTETSLPAGIELLETEALTSLETKHRQLNTCWEQNQSLLRSITELRRQFQPALTSCWQLAAQLRQYTEELVEIIATATARLKEARKITQAILEQQQKDRADVQLSLIALQKLSHSGQSDTFALSQAAEKLINMRNIISVIPDTPYISTIPKIDMPQIYQLDIDEPNNITKPDFDINKAKLLLKNIISEMVSVKTPTQTPPPPTEPPKVQQSLTNITTNRKASPQRSEIDPEQPLPSRLPSACPSPSPNEIDLEFEQELRRLILYDLSKQ